MVLQAKLLLQQLAFEQSLPQGIFGNLAGRIGALGMEPLVRIRQSKGLLRGDRTPRQQSKDNYENHRIATRPRFRAKNRLSVAPPVPPSRAGTFVPAGRNREAG